MKKTCIPRSWSFCRSGDDSTQIVTLPHNAMIYEARQKNCINAYNSGYYPGGSYTYEKELLLEPETHNVLEFDGVMGLCTVFLNGQKVGENIYGYTNFLVDLDAAAKPGTNLLRVDCDNSIEDVSRWYTGSGIYRDVWLHTSGKMYLKPHSVRYTTIQKEEISALVQIAAEVVNDTPKAHSFTLRFDFTRNGTTQTIAHAVSAAANSSQTVQLTASISNAAFWSAENPVLYAVTATLLADGNPVDTNVAPFGIHTLEWIPGKGLLINGTVIKLRGGCIHHDNGILGAASNIDIERRKIRKLKEIGYNVIRSAHNPPSPTQLQACDELGMYVMDEAFDVWYKPKGDNLFQYCRYWDDCKKGYSGHGGNRL